MTHVGVEGFGAGDAQEHSSQDEKSDSTAVREEADRVPWVDGGKHSRIVRDSCQTQACNHDEPQQHDGAEGPADPLRAKSLRSKQRYKYRNRHGHDEWF